MTGVDAFWGMDTDQVRAHGERLRTAADEVGSLTARLADSVRSATWTGIDAVEFRDRWTSLTARQLEGLGARLDALGERALGEAEQQDLASGPDVGALAEQQDLAPEPDDGAFVEPRDLTAEQDPGALRASGSPSPGPGPGPGGDYRPQDGPRLPDRFEGPAEGAAVDLAQVVSGGIGRGLDTGIDRLEEGLGLLGIGTAPLAQFRRDADHLGGILEDWVTGERVPTLAEVGAAGLLTAGSAGVGVHEVLTGDDTPLLDDRPGGIVESVRTDPTRTTGPQGLRDLVLQNDALRLENPGGPLENGRIGIQEVHRGDGGAPVYIVQVPPTEGALIVDLPDAYGGQGNSRDWASNLRLVAGQDPAAMDDVRAAMEAVGVPPGAEVMLVGHSQGGIVAGQLAADPAFNSSSGAPGTYDVTHTFSVGSPIQTVVPAQGSTVSVNVSHEGGIGLGGISGDPIPALDLGGMQVDGGTLTAPRRHEVTLPGTPVLSLDPVTVLESNHDSVGPLGQEEGGYAGSVARAVRTDPTLRALQEELTGRYLGDGTHVTASHVVTVGRGAP